MNSSTVAQPILTTNHLIYQQMQVLKRLPNLAKIDGDMVKPTERELASGISAN
jgi:hypothetical protein